MTHRSAIVAAPIAEWIWPVLVAPFVGSFLGVLIRRLPERKPIGLARSECDCCGRTLAAWELVPLASWLALRGRCRSCGAPIAAFHPAVELAAVLVAVGAIWADAAWSYGGAAQVWVGCGLGWTLLCLGWIDWEQFRLPDALTLPLIIAGLLAAWVLDCGAVTDHAAAAMLGYAGLRLVNAVYRRLRNRDGLGPGDAKLFAACGAWVGLVPLPSVLLFAALGGIAIAVARALAGEQLRATTRLPFGACLAGALWVVWLLMDRA